MENKALEKLRKQIMQRGNFVCDGEFIKAAFPPTVYEGVGTKVLINSDEKFRDYFEKYFSLTIALKRKPEIQGYEVQFHPHSKE